MPKVETFNKTLVLEQAMDVFHDKGYGNTSMQDLVDATQLNRSSIYNSFGSKLKLFMECLKVYQARYNRAMSKELLRATNPFNAIELLFDMYTREILKDKQDKGCMITNCTSEMAHHEPIITDFLNNNQERTIQLFEDLVSSGQKESIINKNKSAKEYALYLYSSLQGFRMTGILITDKSQLRGIAKTILQTLI